MWQSLACDYLSVMASSVSSERAFSSAGITICKRRNRLDADIVESLQCLKSFIQQNLMAQDVVSIAEEEQELNDMDGQPMNQDVKKQPSQDVLHGDAAEEELGLARLVSSYTLPHQNSQPGKRGRQTACSKVLSRHTRDT